MTKKTEFTQEMIDDLSNLGDKKFSKKWKVSLPLIIRRRRELGIKSFNKQYGIKEHKFENGIEYKWCPMGDGHWDILDNFSFSKDRLDGRRGLCKLHNIEVGRKSYIESNGRERSKQYRQTDSGKTSLRRVWRKQKAIKDNAYVLWDSGIEERAYNLFGGSCAYCGIKVDFLKIEFDHFVPIKNGGKTEPSNMLPCCTKCNHGKGGKFTKDAWEWLSERFGIERADYVYQDCVTKLTILGE